MTKFATRKYASEPFIIWVRSRNCGCLVTWFCYQLIAKPGNKTAAVSWPDPYTLGRPLCDQSQILIYTSVTEVVLVNVDVQYSKSRPTPPRLTSEINFRRYPDFYYINCRVLVEDILELMRISRAFSLGLIHHSFLGVSSVQASQMMPNYLKKKTQIHKMTKDCNFRLITGPKKAQKLGLKYFTHLKRS